ncbi:hypothetical protein AALP_AAs67432U000100 [Arabis alpina]|uniref:Protein RALF-like 27 n=1 Tax=Arabis alpina TaxID=50452 RepID=A0A087FZV8_ARAAL|nr:hypothetical protein AALP_AAs67432U000100 [Arabis alpina]
MTKSIFSFFFIFSLLLLLEATSATASARNATSELRYGRCAPGVTVSECITAMHDEEEEEEEEGVEAVVRRILQQKKYLIPRGRQAVCNGKFVGDCIGAAYTNNPARCTYYNKCKHYGTSK